MKKYLVLFIFFIFLARSAYSAEGGQMAPPKVSVELARIQSLAGKWEGSSKHGDGTKEKIAVDYRVTSGGSAVTETIFAGTPHEMVSVYYDENGKLSMTHYCMLGNRPVLELQSTASGLLKFSATPQTQTQLAGQAYMNSLVLTEVSPNELIQIWGGVGMDGKPSDTTVISLKRV